MNEAQATLAAAYAHVFSPGPQTQTVMDDALTYCNTIQEPMVRAGAILLWGFLNQRATALRRAKARGK